MIEHGFYVHRGAAFSGGGSIFDRDGLHLIREGLYVDREGPYFDREGLCFDSKGPYCDNTGATFLFPPCSFPAPCLWFPILSGGRVAEGSANIFSRFRRHAPS